MKTSTTPKSDIFLEPHKRGAKIVSVYVRDGQGTITERKTLGAIKRHNDWQTESLGHRFLTNDWTAPDFVEIDGERVHNPAKVAYHDTRKQAMDRLLALA